MTILAPAAGPVAMAPQTGGVVIDGIVNVRDDNIPVNKWGWPLVPHPYRPGETLLCHRPSSLAKKYLTDSYNVDMWRKRVILTGAANRLDIIEQAAPLHVTDDKEKLNKLVDAAYDAGGGNRNAGRGTARHSWMELILTGRFDEASVPDNIAADVEAIRRCLAENGVQLVDDWAEQFVINPEVPAAGSPDAYVTCHLAAGSVVLDLKTGAGDPRSFSGPLEHGVQLATYAHATHGWAGVDALHRAAPLRPTPSDLNVDTGLILWAPLDTGHAELIGIDIAEGWRMTDLAMQVKNRARRNEKRLLVNLERRAPVLVGATHDQSFVASTLAQRIVALRRRMRDITKLSPLTPAGLGELWPTDHNGERLPTLKTPSLHGDASVDALEAFVNDLEAQFRLEPIDDDTRHRLIAAVESLPVDLIASIDAKATAEGVPNLRGRGVRLCHAELVEGWVAEQGDVALTRKAVTMQMLEGFDSDAAQAMVDIATAGRTTQSLVELTALEHLVVVSVAAAVSSGADLTSAGLAEFFGSKRAVIDAARPVAEGAGFGKPRSCDGVAADHRLAALTWAAQAEDVVAEFVEAHDDDAEDLAPVHPLRPGGAEDE